MFSIGDDWVNVNSLNSAFCLACLSNCYHVVWTVFIEAKGKKKKTKTDCDTKRRNLKNRKTNCTTSISTDNVFDLGFTVAHLRCATLMEPVHDHMQLRRDNEKKNSAHQTLEIKFCFDLFSLEFTGKFLFLLFLSAGLTEKNRLDGKRTWANLFRIGEWRIYFDFYTDARKINWNCQKKKTLLIALKCNFHCDASHRTFDIRNTLDANASDLSMNIHWIKRYLAAEKLLFDFFDTILSF